MTDYQEASASATMVEEARQLSLPMAFPGSLLADPVKFRVEGNHVVRELISSTGKKVTSRQSLYAGSPDQTSEEIFDKSWLTSKRKPKNPGRNGDIIIADLFCGCGGISLGLLEACRAIGKRPRFAFACEMIEDYLDVYRRNFSPAHSYSNPIEEAFDRDVGEELSASEREWAKKIGPLTIAVGGPPCQGHSDLNNYTRRNDPRNSLYMKMVRFADEWWTGRPLPR